VTRTCETAACPLIYSVTLAAALDWGITAHALPNAASQTDIIVVTPQESLLAISIGRLA